MTFNIALVNMRDGSVQGHRAGCADLKRNSRMHADEVWTFGVSSKVEAWESYNSDFIGECPDHDNCDESQGVCSNTYTIEWLPCADHVPNTITPEENTMIKHTLTADGAAFTTDFKRVTPTGTSGVGHAVCGCGAKSPELPTRAARKVWFADHKNGPVLAEVDRVFTGDYAGTMVKVAQHLKTSEVALNTVTTKNGRTKAVTATGPEADVVKFIDLLDRVHHDAFAALAEYRETDEAYPQLDGWNRYLASRDFVLNYAQTL